MTVQYNVTSTPNDPTFDGVAIFNSVDANSNSFCEGVCYTSEYQQIYQSIHFDGNTGDYVICHGYPDMEWRYEGKISADTLANLQTILAAIETLIDSNTGDPSTYKALVVTDQTTYAKAQVRHLHKSKPQKTFTGWFFEVVVSGVIQSSSTQDGAS